MKKTLKVILSFSLIIMSFFTFYIPNSEAACKPSNIGPVCGKEVQAVHKVKTYYTKTDVNKMVKKYDSLGSNKSLIIAYLLSLKSPPIGLSVLFHQIGFNNIIPPFKKAKAKGTGLEISYTMTIYKGTTNRASISGTKYTYR